MKTFRNHVQLIGRLGADPEVKNLEKGMKVARLSLATNEVIMRQGKRVEETSWHRLVVWGKLASTCKQYLRKGREIAVSGKLTYNTWKDNKGQMHTDTQIVVSELLLLGSPAAAR
jgi:single-strand DNA-binding protein